MKTLPTLLLGLGAAAVAASVATCSLLRQPPDPFFEAPYERWPDNARKLPTEHVYALYKEQLEMPPPSEPTLAAPLGERGRAAIQLMIADLDQGDQTILKGYYTLLSETSLRSDFDFCSTDYYYRINRGLEKSFGLRYPRDRTYAGGQANAFDRLCGLIVAGEGKPPGRPAPVNAVSKRTIQP
ncbi:MAG TPA: hypothetical protein VFP12_03550 [Allosphingosinicella sp.]|nr:hypothetical protein [Allosphingosinicella sp.]